MYSRILSISIVLACGHLLVSCGRKASVATEQSEATPTAVRYPTPEDIAGVLSYLRVGMTKDELINAFGNPASVSDARDGEQALMYIWPIDTDGVTTSHVTNGVTVFVKGDTVTQWAPSTKLVARNTQPQSRTTVEPTPVAPDKRGGPVVELCVAAEQEANVSDSAKTPPGQGSRGPCFRFQSIESLEEGRPNNTAEAQRLGFRLYIGLSEGTRTNLYAFTKQFAFKTVNLLVDQESLAALYLKEPIPSMNVELSFATEAEFEKAKRAFSQLLRKADGPGSNHSQ